MIQEFKDECFQRDIKIIEKTEWHYQIKRGKNLLCDVYPSKIKTFSHLDRETIEHNNTEELINYIELILSEFPITLDSFSNKQLINELQRRLEINKNLGGQK